MSDEPPDDLVRFLGGDRVVLRGDRLAILSSVEMEGWEVRGHRKALIRFEGRTWQLVRKTPCGRNRLRYELTPWTPGPLDAPGVEIEYGPEYVQARDEALGVGRRRDAGSVLLHWLSPLVGFLGSGTKRRLEERYGLDPVAATRRSIYVEILLMLGSGTLTSIGVMVQAMGRPAPWPVRPFVLGFLLVALDVLVRYGRMLAEERYPPGLYQWLWKWKGRRRR